MPRICDKEEAFTAYETLKDKLHNSNELSTTNLLNELQEWKVLEDTILHFMISDSTLDQSRNTQDLTRCAIIRNDITNEIIRLTDSQLHTYADIIDIQQSFNKSNLRDRYPDIFHNAELFFNELTGKTNTGKTAHVILTEYTDKLLLWESRGFSSKQDMLEFIKEEDRHFVSFLDHLYEYDSKSVQSIIMETNHISKLMFQAANAGTLNTTELKIYMGIRTNRRLIQNAIKCADAIRLEQVQTPVQAAMTISILLNPYSNYNQICTGIHTKKQIEELRSLGKQIPPLINHLKQQGLINELSIDSLPNKIIKEHILITMK